MVVSGKERHSLSINALFFFMLPTFTCYSQDSLSIAKFDYNGSEFTPKMNVFIHNKTNTFSSYISQYYALKREEFMFIRDTTCAVGTAMIKFKVTPKRGILDVACTKSTPCDLAKMFKGFVQHSSPYWSARGDSNLYYIMAINYNFLNGCEDRWRNKNISKGDIFEFDDGIRLENAKSVILNSWRFSTGVVDSFGAPDYSKQITNSSVFVEKVIRAKDPQISKAPSFASVRQDTTAKRAKDFLQMLKSNNEEIRKAIESNGGKYYFVNNRYVREKVSEGYGLIYDDFENVFYMFCGERIITAFIFKDGKLISYFASQGKDGKRRPWIL